MPTMTQERKRIDQLIQLDKQSDTDSDVSFQLAMSEIKNHLMNFVAAYGDEHGLTIAETERRVSQFDLAEWKKAVQAMKREDLQDLSKVRLKALIATAGLSKHYMLYALIGLSIIKLTNRQEIAYRARIAQDVIDEANHVARDSKGVKQLLRGTKKLVDEKVDTSKWSERLWNGSDQLTNAVKQSVDDALRNGMTTDNVANKLFPYLADDKLDTSIYADFKRASFASQRLIRTESARVKFAIDMQYYHATGVKWVMWVTEPSACQKCVELEESGPYTVDDCPSIPDSSHPNCRCSILPADAELI